METKKLYDAKEHNNIKEIIYEAVGKYNKNTAFVIKHKEGKRVEYENVTYKRLLEDINSLGTSLYEMGLKGKRIAVIGKNRYEWALAHLTNLLGGIVCVPLDKDLEYDELENSLVRSKADAIVFDEKLTDKMNEIKKNGKTSLKEYICMDKKEDFKNIPELIEQGKKLIKKGKNEYRKAKIDSNAMAILLFTSGTTSESKVVMLSHYNVARNISDMQLVEDFRPTDVNLAFLPLHHTFGSTGQLIMLSSGIATAFPDGLRYIAQNLKEYKVT